VIFDPWDLVQERLWDRRPVSKAETTFALFKGGMVGKNKLRFESVVNNK